MNTHKNCTVLKEEYFFYIRTSKFGAEAERSHFFRFDSKNVLSMFLKL